MMLSGRMDEVFKIISSNVKWVLRLSFRYIRMCNSDNFIGNILR